MPTGYPKNGINKGWFKKGNVSSKEILEKAHSSWRGKKHTEKWKENARKTHKDVKGANNPNWKGGICFEPYGFEFNNDLKEVIRNRDRRKCQMCEKTELEEGRTLHIHHIDYNKKNNNPNNLISLCHSCHAKTNGKRSYWINYFQQIIKIKKQNVGLMKWMVE